MMHLSLLVLAMFAPPGDPPTAADIVSALETATIDAIAKAQPSVVAIARVRGDDPDKITAIRGEPAAAVAPIGPDNKLQRFQYAAPGDFSSGVVIGADGEILTTYHTLRGAAQIWVRTADKQEFEAVIIAADPRSDLAVIAPRNARADLVRKLTPMTLGDAAKMRPGTFLLALGNPYNAARDGKASAGWGILANTARRVHAPTGDNVGVGVRAQFFRYQPTLLQLDSKLNLGMSGGAVVNMKGELVGLTTAAASPVAYDVQAGYAIPMDALGRRIADTLRQGKEFEYGFLGIGLDEKVPNGVANVGRGTPAENAGLVVGDQIVAVGDRTLDDDDGLTMALAEVEVGRDVKLKVRRGDDLVDITAFVSKYPVNYGQVIATNRAKPWRGLRVDFTSVVKNANGFDFTLMTAMAQGGVAVTDVETGGAADLAGLKKDAIITRVDGLPVPTPAAFAKAVAGTEGKPVTLTISSGVDRPRDVVVGK
jgi:serine protease Do